ncbi:telomere zinc finger-associated protein-like [Mizuhopecten yessoensis]|uniref:Zinc finger and BTB domain-containing protein 48 n=1 Tax=Mizuhopecten yessoensis TaxID=6573 RepID=A0A210PHY1_MIZYE|nr:telomere zinc finger-associated protein-like [Mizuhopecten yessoensis]OWF36104.1 Zinc finger and BTB domain-containing protein 48 [Mizuhopecten yessoensis]
MEQVFAANQNPVLSTNQQTPSILPTNQNSAFIADQDTVVLPTSPDFEMETICSDLENQIDPTVLDDIDLYLECDDDDVNFNVPVPKDYKNVTFKVSFYPGSQNSEEVGQRKFMCRVCEEEFKMETKFKVHMADRHGDKKPFVCSICSYKAASIKLRKQHFVKVHNIENSSDTSFECLSSVNRPKMKFICSKCSYITTRKDELVTHFNKNHSKADNLFSCDQCSFVCKQKKTFSLHIKKHERTSSELVCEICGKDFITNTQFNRHYKIHKEERPFKCSIPGCETTFKIQGALTDHVKSVHRRCEKQNLKPVGHISDQSKSELSDKQTQ